MQVEYIPEVWEDKYMLRVTTVLIVLSLIAFLTFIVYENQRPLMDAQFSVGEIMIDKASGTRCMIVGVYEFPDKVRYRVVAGVGRNRREYTVPEWHLIHKDKKDKK